LVPVGRVLSSWVPVHGRTPAHDSLLRIQLRPRICLSLRFPRLLQDPSSSHFSLTGGRTWDALLVFFTGCSQASVLRHFLSLKFHVLRSQLLPKESVMPEMSCPCELFFPLPNRLSGAGLRNSVLQLACSSSSRLVHGSEARVGDFLLSIHIFICCVIHSVGLVLELTDQKA
jgi:hypothetical protein